MANTKELLNEKYCEIYFEASKNIITAKWKGFLHLNQVVYGCEILTDFIKNNPNVTHLSDHRELKILTQQNQDYITSWFVAVAEAGLKKIAVLVAKDIFASLTVEQVNTTNHIGSLQIKTFQTREQCEEFLGT